MWRAVIRPLLLRPPDLFFTSTRLLAGSHLVSSSKAGSDLKRCVGVRGRKLLSAILNQVDLLAFLQRHDCFLPMRLAPEILSALAFLFSGVIAGVNIENFLLEHALDGVLDLDLIRPRTDAKNILVQLLAQYRRFLSQRRGLNNVVRLVHFILSANFSSAFGVTKIFSKASSCSVFTSAAVASRTGFTFRADF